MLVTSSSLTASGVIAKSEAFWTEMVEPSGSALATSAAASAPLAPERLITGKEPPSSSDRPCGDLAADQVGGAAGVGADRHLDRAGGVVAAVAAAAGGVLDAAAGGEGEGSAGGDGRQAEGLLAHAWCSLFGDVTTDTRFARSMPVQAQFGMD